MHYLEIESDFEKIAKDYQVTIDRAAFIALLQKRQTHSDVKIPRSIEAAFAKDSEVRPLLEEHYSKLAREASEELAESEKKLEEVSKKLANKVTKTAQTEKARIEKKIQKNRWALEKKIDDPIRSFDKRIYPLSYAGLIIREGTQNVLRPLRFQLRPAGEDANYDKESGLYKARRESLTSKYFERIRDQSGKESRFERLMRKCRAILVVSSFHEYAEKGNSVGFSMQAPFLVPCLFDRWVDEQEASELFSFAVITTEAPQSVLNAGYHRSPVALKNKYFDSWLAPTGMSVDALQDILADNEDETFFLSA